MKSKLLLTLAGSMLLASAAWAQSVSVNTRLFLETYVAGKDGAIERQLKPATTITPGDRLVYVIAYKNAGARPAADFVITNPLAKEVEFVGEETAGAEMSVDGGRTWGALTALKVALPNGTSRPARRADVTHLRWRLAQPIAAGGEGQVTFKGRLK